MNVYYSQHAMMWYLMIHKKKMYFMENNCFRLIHEIN